jgi:homogentisate 1,2-dioxygenase
MLPHGPDANAFAKASTAELAPQKLGNTLAFMFETRYPQHVTKWAVEDAALQATYQDCWPGLKRNFTGKP